MAKTTHSTRVSSSSFDVTCVIGQVQLSGEGTVSPVLAAFELIALHDARGTYQFPMGDGRTMTVNVDYPDELRDGYRQVLK